MIHFPDVPNGCQRFRVDGGWLERKSPYSLSTCFPSCLTHSCSWCIRVCCFRFVSSVLCFTIINVFRYTIFSTFSFIYLLCCGCLPTSSIYLRWLPLASRLCMQCELCSRVTVLQVWPLSIVNYCNQPPYRSPSPGSTVAQSHSTRQFSITTPARGTFCAHLRSRACYWRWGAHAIWAVWVLIRYEIIRQTDIVQLTVCHVLCTLSTIEAQINWNGDGSTGVEALNICIKGGRKVCWRVSTVSQCKYVNPRSWEITSARANTRKRMSREKQHKQNKRNFGIKSNMVSSI